MTTRFEAPADLTTLSPEELSAKLEEAANRFAVLNEIPEADLPEDDANEIIAISDFTVAARKFTTAREERAARLSAARQTMSSAPEGDGDEGSDGDEGAEEPAAAANDADEDAEDGDEEESVTAAADGRSGSAIKNAARKNPVKRRQTIKPTLSLTAAADVPGFSTGHEFDSLTAAGKAIAARLKAYPTARGNNVIKQKLRNGAVVINMPDNPLNDVAYKGRMDELLLTAASEARLQGGSLTAAGGWGAPSEIVLDFCDIEVNEGFATLPTVTITRGGQQYTKGPSLATIEASATGFWDMDEATAEAGVEQKTSIRPEVPAFDEVRLDAVGVMVEAGLLLRAGWPEVIDRTTKLALLVHQRKINRKVIDSVRGYTGAAINVPNGFGNALDVLHGLDVVAAGERQRNSMGRNQTLEVWLPHWVKNVVRADLANRNGVENFLNITDAQIEAFFTARKLRVQWLYGMQDLVTPAGGVATAYPATVEAIMYPAGTFVRGEAPVITLDTVYDSVNLKRNDYVHLFSEQGIAVMNPCNDARRLTIPLAANGRTGAADITGDLYVAPAVP